MGKFDHWQWRKLFTREQGTFALLPLYVRALGAELLKFCDDDGRIPLGGMAPWAAVARVAGATASDRRLLKKHIKMLLDDGYLVLESDHLVIRNMPVAQGRKRDATATRTVHEPDASGARVVHEPDARNDSSGEKHSTPDPLVEKSREELEITHTPTRARDEQARAVDAPPEDLTTRAVLGALRGHDELHGIATERCAEHLAGNIISRGIRVADAIEAIAEAARDVGAKISVAGAVPDPQFVANLVGRFVWNAKLRRDRASQGPPARAAPAPPPGYGPVGSRVPNAKLPPPLWAGGDAR